MSIESPSLGSPDRPKVGIEAGHIYSPNHLFEPSGRPTEALHGLALATRVRDRLEQAEYDTHHIFFVDDIVPREAEQEEPEDKWRWRAFMSRPLEQASQLIEPSLRIMSEHDAIGPGLDLVETIKGHANSIEGWRLSRDGRHVVYGKGPDSETIPLLGYQRDGKDYPDIPSCEVMDLATYKQRIKDTGQTVTLLPEWYGPEQARVQKLFELLGERPPVVTAFYDEKGQIQSVADWSGGHFEELADILRSIDQI